jgi:hypothetical protein
MLQFTVKETDYEMCPIGIHNAGLLAIIDLGTHVKEFKGEKKKAREVMLVFEIEQKNSKGEAFLISKIYSLYLNVNSNLRKDLESWRGKAFTNEDLKNLQLAELLGTPAMLHVMEKESAGKKRSVINTIMPPAKSIVLKNKPYGFSLENKNFEVLDKMSEWVVNMIKTSDEYNEYLLKEDIREKGDQIEDEENDIRTLSKKNDADTDDLPF